MPYPFAHRMTVDNQYTAGAGGGSFKFSFGALPVGRDINRFGWENLSVYVDGQLDTGADTGAFDGLDCLTFILDLSILKPYPIVDHVPGNMLRVLEHMVYGRNSLRAPADIAAGQANQAVDAHFVLPFIQPGLFEPNDLIELTQIFGRETPVEGNYNIDGNLGTLITTDKYNMYPQAVLYPRAGAPRSAPKACWKYWKTTQTQDDFPEGEILHAAICPHDFHTGVAKTTRVRLSDRQTAEIYDLELQHLIALYNIRSKGTLQYQAGMTFPADEWDDKWFLPIIWPELKAKLARRRGYNGQIHFDLTSTDDEFRFLYQLISRDQQVAHGIVAEKGGFAKRKPKPRTRSRRPVEESRNIFLPQEPE